MSVVAIITASTIATAVDGPFVAPQFGRGREAVFLQLINRIFGLAFVAEGALKLMAMGMSYFDKYPR